MAPGILEKDSTSEDQGWTSAAAKYQEKVGKTSITGTNRIVEIVNDTVPFTSDSYILDVGTGGGSLPISVRAKAPDGAQILATDIAKGMIEEVDKLKLHNTKTQLEDAVDLGDIKDDTFSHVFTSFAIQFCTDQTKAVSELYRVLKPGKDAMAGIAIWSIITGPVVIHDRAAKKILPSYKPVYPYAPGSWAEPEDHKQKLEEAGFKNVGVESIDIPFPVDSGADFADYFFTTSNPVAVKMRKSSTAQGIDQDELKKACISVVDDEMDGGKGVFFRAILGYGQKI